jgi:16S rRNA (adenine1518-N6/adenine1519-N6)-dimethyltransferase
MNRVRAKKKLGQHFLKDGNIARKIAGSMEVIGYDSVLEIGPGMGILTEILLERKFADFRVVEIDNESIVYLKSHFPDLKHIIEGDFLQLDLDEWFPSEMGIIGNFPYNISTQILFRVLKYRYKVLEVTGMFQKEVAERISAGPGSKTYGILSVLLQAFYDIEYLFTVSENVFSPPPKVKSAVIRLARNNTKNLDCNENLFFSVVKASFNQRRKTLRNSIRAVFELSTEDNPILKLRPEQLSVDQFISLTNWLEKTMVVSK